jgi:hypothetical protein
MTLSELFDMVQQQATISSSRLKDIKTSLRYLAKAFGAEGPERCHEKHFLTCRWKNVLDAYFVSLQAQGQLISPHTVRNTRNNLSFLFRQASELKIFDFLIALPQIMSREQALQTSYDSSPYRQHWLALRPNYRMKIKDWPPVIKAGWDAYTQERRLHVRESYLNFQRENLECLVGYAINIEHKAFSHWENLFGVQLLKSFVTWHSNRVGQKLTARASMTTKGVTIIARYLKHPEAEALTAFRRSLPTPEPLHDKQAHWITLRELEQVALKMLADARKLPVGTRTQHTGIFRACLHSRSLILRILVRIPLRQRNIREMQLDRNLCKDQDGHWYLSFKGQELKVSMRRGRLNQLRINLTENYPDLISHIEEYIYTYRPLYQADSSNKHVFLTRQATQHTNDGLRLALRKDVFSHAEKRFYPHLIRTIWATEYISETGDFTTAAYMLNDTVEVVMRRYQEIFEKAHITKASRFLKDLLGPAAL